ncbi:hypothetical protein, partial [Pseudomonas syringae group genomosp. 7]|uniref:hypothetical protein n=1 Tax=Pseudomonas syringae group genomosp. 7 TaxID=251699 RepID=UPI00376F5253
VCCCWVVLRGGGRGVWCGSVFACVRVLWWRGLVVGMVGGMFVVFFFCAGLWFLLGLLMDLFYL